MKVIKYYCCLMIVQADEVYYCIDRYTNKVKTKGTLESCEKFLREYMNDVMERR